MVNKVHKSQVTKFCTVAPHVFSIIIAVCFLTCENVYQFTYTEQKAPDNSEIHRSPQNCGSLVWNFPHVNFQAPEIWRWLLDLWKIFGPQMVNSFHKVSYSSALSVLVFLQLQVAHVNGVHKLQILAKNR
jgi:hypothetical protein